VSDSPATTLSFDGPLDLRATLAPLGAAFGDPTLRATAGEAVRATRTPDGPATIHARIAAPGALLVRAWGDGAGWMLARARGLFGLDDDATAIADGLRDLAKRAAGARLARSERVFELLAVIVLEQLVSGADASRAFAKLVRRFSEPAPGPFEELWLPLGPEQVRAIPAAAFPACGALARQGATLNELARRATRVEEAAHMDTDAAERRLLAFPGVGRWTARSAMLRGLGHADAVPLGDYGLPRIVAYNLTGADEPRADDARMLELLEPWRGQRGRVIRWIDHSGRLPPRRGPRAALREIDPEGRWLLRSPR
jgi:3-methyladenine DNA glycosylase/8-oxoguanine DNA glycosylase